MSHLFSPLTVGRRTIKNRAWVSPMCQYSAHDGVVGDWHRVHLGAFATGGAGLIMAEATAIDPAGRISVYCPGLWNDAQTAAWRTVTDFAHEHGAMIGIQLAHAGRKGSTLAPWDDHVHAHPDEGGWQTVAPSALAFAGYPEPRALSVAEIEHLVDAFADGATRAMDARFDLVEIHAAHGYLLHQFLSPLSNHRDDQYGGSFENRIRFLLDVVDAVRARIADAPLFVRLSATDWAEGGWDIVQSVALATILKDHGVDLVDASSGGNVDGVHIPVAPGYQVPFAEAIRREAGIATSAVGLITEPAQAEAIIAEGRADAVMLARANLRNPRWALNAAESFGEVIEWPHQFDRARTVRHG